MSTFKSLFGHAATKTRYSSRTDDGVPITYTVTGPLAAPSLSALARTVHDYPETVKVKCEFEDTGKIVPVSSTGEHVAKQLLTELEPAKSTTGKSKTGIDAIDARNGQSASV